MWRSELGILRSSNRRRMEQVRLEDASLIRRICGKLAIPRLGLFDQEMVCQELLDRAEEAETRGKSLQQELGMSAEEFCRGVLEKCQPAGWIERLLQSMIHWAIYSAYFFLGGPLYWAMSYEGFELRQQLTGEDLGLQGPGVFLFPLWPLAALAMWMIVLELWEQFFGPRLAVRRYGRTISILFYVAWWAIAIGGLKWMEDQPYFAQPLVALRIPPMVIGYLVAVCLLYLLYRVGIHRRSKEYQWQRIA